MKLMFWRFNFASSTSHQLGRGLDGYTFL